MRASSTTAVFSATNRSPAIRVAVDAGQVAVLADSHPGPPLTGTYPLLKTSSVRDMRAAFRSMGQSAVNTTRNRALLSIIR